MAAHQAGKFDEAEGLYRRVLDVDEKQYPVLQMLGVLYAQRGNYQEAERRLQAAISLNPNDAGGQFNYGNVLLGLQRLDEAFAAFSRALALNPVLAEAELNRGSILMSRKDFEEAIGCFDAVIRINRNYAEAHCNRGHALQEIKRYDEALASCDAALAINPQNAEFHATRASVLHRLKRFDEALGELSVAISLQPANAGFQYNRGNILFELKRFSEAVAAYDDAFGRDSQLEYVEGDRFFAKLMICDWTNHAVESERLVAGVAAGRAVARPFVFQAIDSGQAMQTRCANLFVGHEFPAAPYPSTGQHNRHDRIRVAYISSDFRTHPVSYLIAGLIEGHSRARFNVTGISLQPEESSGTGQRMKRAFDSFVDASKMADKKIAQLIHEQEIDIAIDLNGFTRDARTNIFAQRPAPIQVNYLGYPGTMGAPYIDYIIADQIVAPAHQQEFYSEKIVYMPNSFQANDRERSISEKIFTRAELGLPPDGFVFCCFNNSYKINPDVFGIWMRILNQVNDSVLWLVADDKAVENNLRREAAARNISGERLIFAARIPYAEHLARLSSADLFLDTAPFNAGTTASDALWAKLPVLTRISDGFSGRMAASLLTAIDLPELITSTPQAYEALAIEMARSPEKLAEIKHRLSQNRLTKPLFNTQLFVRHIEQAYEEMYERYQAGLSPENIHVPR